jgi:hypothetical protein
MIVKILRPLSYIYDNIFNESLVNLEVNLNDSNIQPLFLYTNSSKHIRNIKKKFGTKSYKNIDFSKIKEDLIIISDSLLFEDIEILENNGKWASKIKRNLNENNLIDFLKKCKENKIDIILCLNHQSNYHLALSICKATNIEYEYTEISSIKAIDIIKKELTRFLSLRYFLKE